MRAGPQLRELTLPRLTWELVPFAALRPEQLYAILALRLLVFTVEQNCPYQDCDGKDLDALHLMGIADDGRLLGYARLLAPGVCYAAASIGRVVTHPDVRRRGVGKAVMRAAIVQTRAAYGAGPIRIGAQLYVQRFYEEFGFAVAGPTYDEDGIPHVEMLLA